jgi:hypothetical protein
MPSSSRCDQCATPIKQSGACLTVFHPDGISGTFCSDSCYKAKIASSGEQPIVITTTRLHDDADVVLGREG